QSLKERAGLAFVGGRLQHAMHQRLRERDFENAKQIEREHEHDHAEAENKIWIRELRRPGDFMTGRSQRDQQQRQSNEPDKNSGDERETVAQDRAPIFSSVLDESEDLERDDRQYARHQIQ